MKLVLKLDIHCTLSPAIQDSFHPQPTVLLALPGRGTQTNISKWLPCSSQALAIELGDVYTLSNSVVSKSL